jgi:hypothetical protein
MIVALHSAPKGFFKTSPPHGNHDLATEQPHYLTFKKKLKNFLEKLQHKKRRELSSQRKREAKKTLKKPHKKIKNGK